MYMWVFDPPINSYKKNTFSQKPSKYTQCNKTNWDWEEGQILILNLIIFFSHEQISYVMIHQL